MTALELTTDVLVIGGGPAATWAALKAAQDGADVVLADKGYCGTSGATASAGTGVWYVPPEPAAREAAMASGEALGGYLADRRWMTRVLDQTYAGINEHLRHGDRLTASLKVLDSVWEESRASLRAGGEGAVLARQAAAMTAHARWMYASALARTETRGMAKRLDFPAQDPGQHHRIVTGGLDRVWTRTEPPTTAPTAPPAPLEVAP